MNKFYDGTFGSANADNILNSRSKLSEDINNEFQYMLSQIRRAWQAIVLV